jgi:hypothetical protein
MAKSFGVLTRWRIQTLLMNETNSARNSRTLRNFFDRGCSVFQLPFTRPTESIFHVC